LKQGLPREHRSAQIDRFRRRIAALDPSSQWTPEDIRQAWTREGDEA
jgi:hypothetical protein